MTPSGSAEARAAAPPGAFSGAPATVRVVRPDDHVVLAVGLTGFDLDPTVSPARGEPRFTLVARDAARLVFTLPSQHVVEYAGPPAPAGQVGPVRAVQERAIFTPDSVVEVGVPPGRRVPFSVAGLLGALADLPVDAAAGRFSLPYRLELHPAPVSPLVARLTHAPRALTRADRTELWSSRLRVSAPGGRPVDAVVPVRLAAPPVAANPSPLWTSTVVENKINNALTSAVCDELAKPGGTGALHRLDVSSLGGSLDLRASRLPDVVEYQHLVEQGRDTTQRVVQRGVLYPLGHEVVATSSTARAFERPGTTASNSPTTRAASLQTVTTLSVVTPTVDYPLSKSPGWPYASVTLPVRTSPTGQLLDPEVVPGTPRVPGVQVLFVGGRPWPVPCRGTDRAGGVSTFAYPMLFVPLDHRDDADLPALLAGLKDGDHQTLRLDGQAVALTPDEDVTHQQAQARERARASDALATPPVPRDVSALATAVRARAISVAVDAEHGLPQVDPVKGLRAQVDAVDAFAPGFGEVVLAYAQPYLDHLYDDAGNAGKVFLEHLRADAQDKVVGLAREATAGLASLDLPVAGLAKDTGALVGAAGAIDRLAQGKLDLGFLDSGQKLLGFFPLRRLLPELPGPGLPDLDLPGHQRMRTFLDQGVLTTELVLDLPLMRKESDNFDVGVTRLAPFRAEPGDPNTANLHIEQVTTLDTATGTAGSRSVCELTAVELQLFPGTPPPPQEPPDPDDAPLVRIAFRSVRFESHDAKGPDVDVKLGPVRFGGILAFVGVLAELVDELGLSDPPALAVGDDSITSSFSFPIPRVAVGMFALENITFATALTLSLKDEPLRARFAFAKPSDPFKVAVAALAGGGHLAIELSTDGLAAVVGGLQFGASLALDLVVASASVEAMGGVDFSYTKGSGVAITAFFRVHGELEVLCLLTVSVTLTIALTYRSSDNALFGRAELAVEVKLLFFSETVVVPFEQRFAGGNADPTFLELMAPADLPVGAELPWDEYCRAFVEA